MGEKAQKVALYKAEWCGYCKRFAGPWQAITKILEKNDIKTEIYDDKDNKDIIEKEGIRSFPTVKIFSKEGVKEVEADVDAILNEAGVTLSGGGSDKNIDYKEKYLKYKEKYLKLKENLQIEHKLDI